MIIDLYYSILTYCFLLLYIHISIRVSFTYLNIYLQIHDVVTTLDIHILHIDYILIVDVYTYFYYTCSKYVRQFGQVNLQIMADLVWLGSNGRGKQR